MSSKLTKAKNANVFPIGCLPDFVESQLQYECIMGSQAYGTNTDTSDVDIVGFSFPRKEMAFPHLAGFVRGYDLESAPNFEQFQQHHVQVHGTEYDFTIYNITKFFSLLSQNNPNIVDAIFVPQDCVTHCTAVGQLVRDNRHVFLSKAVFHKFRGYAYSQLNKAKSRKATGNRAEKIKELGYCPKFLSHVARLMLQADQLLSTGDMDLRRDREYIKAIKRGDVSFEDVEKQFNDYEKKLEELYRSSDILPHKPDHQKIKNLLIECLQMHFGDLSACVADENRAIKHLEDAYLSLSKGLGALR